MPRKNKDPSRLSRAGSPANALFAQADTNRDGVIDRKEFENIVGSSDPGAKRIDGSYGPASGRSVPYSFGDGVPDVTVVNTVRPLYEPTRTTTGVSLEPYPYGGSYRPSPYEQRSDLVPSTVGHVPHYADDIHPEWCRYGAEVRGPGLYYDPNPEIIRREVPAGTHTCTQNVRIRFLQPPPVHQQGTLTIREVRPPQQPPLPPLRIKQVETAVGEFPPLILRERPPLPPSALGSETIVRNLPALPVPPRSVIIERYAAARTRPRDIIIERWLPYSATLGRKTIVQRAEGTIDYPPPRNIIILYESTGGHVVRKFENLGVTQEDPQAYLARYGRELLDSESLLREARAAGVLEDISIPTTVGTYGSSSVPYGSSSVPYGSSSVPYDSSSVTYGSSSVPYGYSSVPYGSRSVTYGSSSAPYGYSSVPYGSSSVPYGYSSVPYGSSSVPYNSDALLHTADNLGAVASSYLPSGLGRPSYGRVGPYVEETAY